MPYRRQLSQGLAVVLLICAAMGTGYAIATLLTPQQGLPLTSMIGATPVPRQTAVLGVTDSAEDPAAPDLALPSGSPPSTVGAAPAVPLGSASSGLSEALTDLLTEEPIATPAPATEQFVDDAFDTSSSGWIERQTPTWSAGYADGRYLLRIAGQPAMNLASSLGPSDYRLGVDVAVDHGSAGLVFLAAKPATFYRFVISAEGTFALQRQAGDSVSNVVDWTASPALRKAPGSSYRVSIEREGNRVQCMVDDTPVLVWTIPAEPVVSQYGLAVAGADGQAAAAFDNLKGERIQR